MAPSMGECMAAINGLCIEARRGELIAASSGVDTAGSCIGALLSVAGAGLYAALPSPAATCGPLAATAGPATGALTPALAAAGGTAAAAGAATAAGSVAAGEPADGTDCDRASGAARRGAALLPVDPAGLRARTGVVDVRDGDGEAVGARGGRPLLIRAGLSDTLR